LRLALKTVDRSSGQCRARIVHVSRRHPDFQHGQRVQPYRPSFLRRTISRYQLVELFVIIGIILMVWGALSLGRVTSALKQAPSGWLESVRIYGRLCGTLTVRGQDVGTILIAEGLRYVCGPTSCPPRKDWCLL
jgi:hypothetical protein